MKTLILAALGVAAFVPSNLTAPVAITEWTVPYADSRPRDPGVDSEGRVWFVGQVGNYVAYLEPATGKFTRFDLAQGTHPHNLIIDAQDQVWLAGNRNATIGRLDPATGKVTSYSMTDPAAKDPHTLLLDPKRNVIWFTSQQSNGIGLFDPAKGTTRVVALPQPGSRPYGIALDSRGRPWVVEFGANRLATVDPATMALTEISLPDARSRPRRLAITSDDRIWMNDYVRGTLIRYDPATKKFDEWTLPGGARSLPYAMAADDQDRVWVVETGVQPNNLVGVDGKTGATVSETPVLPSGAGTIRHMVFDRKSGAIWFGTDANTVGRAAVR